MDYDARIKKSEYKNRCLLQKAQSILEYVLLIIVIGAAFAAMQVYVNRAVQANLKSLEAQINESPQ